MSYRKRYRPIIYKVIRDHKGDKISLRKKLREAYIPDDYGSPHSKRSWQKECKAQLNEFEKMRRWTGK